MLNLVTGAEPEAVKQRYLSDLVQFLEAEKI